MERIKLCSHLEEKITVFCPRNTRMYRLMSIFVFIFHKILSEEHSRKISFTRFLSTCFAFIVFPWTRCECQKKDSRWNRDTRNKNTKSLTINALQRFARVGWFQNLQSTTIHPYYSKMSNWCILKKCLSKITYKCGSFSFAFYFKCLSVFHLQALPSPGGGFRPGRM